MTMLESDLRTLFSQPTTCTAVDVDDLLRKARSHDRARRARRTVLGSVVVAILTVVAVVAMPRTREPAGLSLTAASSPGVIVTSEGHVRLSNGLEVWRDGDELSIGYPGYAWAGANIHEPILGNGKDGWAGVPDRGIIESIVHDVPREVDVTIGRETRSAEIACFRQTPGWCLWAASFGRPLTRAEITSMRSTDIVYRH